MIQISTVVLICTSSGWEENGWVLVIGDTGCCFEDVKGLDENEFEGVRK